MQRNRVLTSLLKGLKKSQPTPIKHTKNLKIKINASKPTSSITLKIFPLIPKILSLKILYKLYISIF